MLDRKKISAEQLKSTMIGKRLTAVKDTDFEDVELATQIKEIKDLLKKKWTAIYILSKKPKVETKPVVAASKLKLPHIPSDLRGEL